MKVNSYREAFELVLKEYPAAYISAHEESYETDELYIIPPQDDMAEGAPIFLVDKDEGGIRTLAGREAFEEGMRLWNDPSRRPVWMPEEYRDTYPTYRQRRWPERYPS